MSETSHSPSRPLAAIHWLCLLQGHEPDTTRWLLVIPGGGYGCSADVPLSLHPCTRCGAWTEPDDWSSRG